MTTISTTSTSVKITWSKGVKVQITWNMTLSNQCMEKVTQGESFNNSLTEDYASYLITDLNEFTEYNITACIFGSFVCGYSVVVTDEAGMFLFLNSNNI